MTPGAVLVLAGPVTRTSQSTGVPADPCWLSKEVSVCIVLASPPRVFPEWWITQNKQDSWEWGKRAGGLRNTFTPVSFNRVMTG